MGSTWKALRKMPPRSLTPSGKAGSFLDSGFFSYEIPVQEQGSVGMVELELLFHPLCFLSCAVVAERSNTSRKTHLHLHSPWQAGDSQVLSQMPLKCRETSRFHLGQGTPTEASPKVLLQAMRRSTESSSSGPAQTQPSPLGGSSSSIGHFPA